MGVRWDEEGSNPMGDVLDWATRMKEMTGQQPRWVQVSPYAAWQLRYFFETLLFKQNSRDLESPPVGGPLGWVLNLIDRRPIWR